MNPEEVAYLEGFSAGLDVKLMLLTMVAGIFLIIGMAIGWWVA